MGSSFQGWASSASWPEAPGLNRFWLLRKEALQTAVITGCVKLQDGWMDGRTDRLISKLDPSLPFVLSATQLQFPYHPHLR